MSYEDVFRSLGYNLNGEVATLAHDLGSLFTTEEEARNVADLVASARSESEKKETLRTLRAVVSECDLLDKADPYYPSERGRILREHCRKKLAEWEGVGQLQ